MKVIDAMNHPHGGRILRLRLEGEEAPRMKALKGARLRAIGPRGEERTAKVLGFPLMQGKLSDRRIRETGRLDLHVEEEGEGEPITLTWRVNPTG